MAYFQEEEEENVDYIGFNDADDDEEDYDDSDDEKKGYKEGHYELLYDVPVYLLQSHVHIPKVLSLFFLRSFPSKRRNPPPRCADAPL